jgi:tetratricopeptide (TPR) repeat protein
LFNLPSGFSQTDRYTEEEIGITDVFIAANREKLIGNYEKAIELYEEVYKKDRNNATVCYELARTYDQIGEIERAVEYSERSVKLDADNVWFAIFNADVLENSSKHKDAALRYKALAKKEPENKFYYLKWAFNEMESGNTNAALLAYNNLEKKEGITEDITHRKFNIYVSLDKNKEAVNELKALIATDPENTSYLNNLAGFYMNIGKKKEAQKTYKRILEIDPNDPNATIAMAASSGSNMKEISYLRAIRPILSDPSADLDIKIKELIPFIEKVDGMPNNGITAELILISKELLSIHPENAKVHAIFGDILFNSTNYEGAEEQYLKTIELNKKVFAVWEQLMYTQQELQHFEGLLKVSSDAINYYPNQASAYYFNAVANFKINNLTEAVDILNEAIMISGKNNTLKGMSYLLFCEIEYEQKNFKKAEDHGSKAMKLGGHKNPELLEIMGDISFQNKNIEKAVEFWQQALDAGSASEKLSLKIEQRQIIE